MERGYSGIMADVIKFAVDNPKKFSITVHQNQITV
jgi:hypothetical protein